MSTKYVGDFTQALNHARGLLKLGIYPEARKLLERCLELAPDYHLARNSYANALGKAHDFDKALKEIAFSETSIEQFCC